MTPDGGATSAGVGAADPVVAVVGATAAGKSELALDVASAIGGEIVNTDSMQLYRGMDIGTAKLPVAERRGIVHHLLDVLDVDQSASVAQFQEWARTAIADCHRRGVVPVLVGGSALYTRAVVDRFEFPGTDPALRQSLEDQLERLGAPALHQQLAEIDPRAAERIETGNGRRVVRALEVVTLTRRPFSAALPEREYHYPRVRQVGVDVARPLLDERIEARVRAMWDAGLVEEVSGLAARGLREGRTANRALGYQQVLAFLDGELSEAEAFARTVSGTRRFVRRQDAWFRKDDRITWVRGDPEARLSQALGEVSQA